MMRWLNVCVLCMPTDVYARAPLVFHPMLPPPLLGKDGRKNVRQYISSDVNPCVVRALLLKKGLFHSLLCTLTLCTVPIQCTLYAYVRAYGKKMEKKMTNGKVRAVVQDTLALWTKQPTRSWQAVSPHYAPVSAHSKPRNYLWLSHCPTFNASCLYQWLSQDLRLDFDVSQKTSFLFDVEKK